MADPAILGKLLLDSEAFVQDLFGTDSDMAAGAIFARALDRGIPADKLFSIWKNYWTMKFTQGATPYSVNTGGHSAGQGFENYIYDTISGRPTDIRKRQIAVLLAQKAAAEADIAAGAKREDTNIDNIENMLAKLGG